MKVLPRKIDIDRIQKLERQSIIEEGIKLATKIDQLRLAVANEEKMLRDWRVKATTEAQEQITRMIKERDELLDEISKLRRKKEELLGNK